MIPNGETNALEQWCPCHAQACQYSGNLRETGAHKRTPSALPPMPIRRASKNKYGEQGRTTKVLAPVTMACQRERVLATNRELDITTSALQGINNIVIHASRPPYASWQELVRSARAARGLDRKIEMQEIGNPPPATVTGICLVRTVIRNWGLGVCFQKASG